MDISASFGWFFTDDLLHNFKKVQKLNTLIADKPMMNSTLRHILMQRFQSEKFLALSILH